MLKRLHHTGSTLRARSVADKGAIARAVEENALPLIAAGKVKPVIYKTFPLREAAAAHALMETSAAHRQDRPNPLSRWQELVPRQRRCEIGDIVIPQAAKWAQCRTKIQRAAIGPRFGGRRSAGTSD